MSLRLKLLLMSLLTLVLPWAGFQYAREMESVLREAERQSLVAVAETIAASLQGREDLLYRSAVAQELALVESVLAASSHTRQDDAYLGRGSWILVIAVTVAGPSSWGNGRPHPSG